jgi:DUF1680 family protein
MYSITDDGLYINMYGGNKLSTRLKNGSGIQLEQQTNYPWDGNISIVIKEAPKESTILFFRIPGWCKKYQLKVGGISPHNYVDRENGYIELKGKWKSGDKIELLLDMPATLIESNPLVEETRNQVTVKRGPIVYCLESADLLNQNVFDIVIPSSIKFQLVPMKIDNGNIMALTGEAKLVQHNNWKNTLYKEVNTTMKAIKIKLIPYYAWANRGKTDMTVWMPLIRQ